MIHPAFSANTVSLTAGPGSGIAPLTVEIQCRTDKNSAMPVNFMIDYGDGNHDSIASHKHFHTFTHTYDSGYFRPVCRVENDSAAATSLPGSVICARWRFKTGGKIDSSPAIASDGSIIIGSDDQKLYSISPETGEEIWHFTTGGKIDSSPAIGPDGTIYVSSTDRFLYAINPDGARKWSFQAGNVLFTAPAIGQNGRTIYFGGDDGCLYAIASDLGFKWKFQTDGMIVSPPSIGHDGISNIVCFVSTDGNIYALSAETGELKWRFPTNASSCTSPVIDQNGRVYVGECRLANGGDKNQCSLYCLSPDGSIYWKFSKGAGFCSSPAIGPDGVVYAGDRNGTFFVISPNGMKKWAITPEPAGEINAAPAMGSNGVLYAGSSNKAFFSLPVPVDEGVSVGQSLENWIFSTNREIRYSAPVIGADGTIYFGCQDQYVYAINPGTMTLATSAWPMFRRNPAHTGTAGPVLMPEIMSADPALSSTDVRLDIDRIRVFFAMGIKEEDIAIHQFRLEKESYPENEIIKGFSYLEAGPYNNAGERAVAVLKLDAQIPLSPKTAYTASIPYTSGNTATTFSWSFTTASESADNPDTGLKSGSGCFLETVFH